MRNQTLSDENRTLAEEKRSFMSEKAMFTRQYLKLMQACTAQEESYRALKSQCDEEVTRLKCENEKIIQSKIRATVSKNQIQEEYTRLKSSHDILSKEHDSFSKCERKIRSRLKGLVGDDIDKCMEDF